ncbi:alpha-E domain-containing protein [Extensimonas sp. H3M7-6]|nr:alpha-E domain-containing protein [Extensimonas sp. H3M7-6]MDF1482327.1 alpha-E domain-containing protein [Extensimonas sp. H3M7-6]
MLSRTADHLFRLSRCTERADKTAAGGLAPEYRRRAQRVRGSLPALAQEALC